MIPQCPSCAAPLAAGVPVCAGCGRPPTSLSKGAVIASRFDVRADMDAGGAGRVYRAFDRRSEQEVALKVFRTDLVSSAAVVRRFRADIDKTGGITHRNVVRVLDHGEDGPLAYISMEIAPGEDLGQTLKSKPHGLPEAEALAAILQIADGLQAIHDAGLVHTDLTPAHAIRSVQGLVRVLPFGLAKDPLSEGEFLGTAEYMSPEQCWGYDLDPRSDIYLLGIVAFELFVGVVPIRGADLMDTTFRQMKQAPSFEDAVGLRVPRAFVPALRRALEKSVGDRFATAREFAEALRSAAPGAEAVVIPPSIPEAPAAEVRAPARPAVDARREERFTLPTDVRLRKLGPEGAPSREERTIAHDLSRSGMRVLTSWSDLQQGDQVSIEEVGGNFATGAIVRHVSRGTDKITRVGVEFVDKQAPDRMVGTTTGIERPVFDTSRSYPGSSPQRPTPVSPLGGSEPFPRPTLTTSVARPAYTTSIPRPAVVRPPAPPAPPPPAAPKAPRSLESVLEEFAAVKDAAQALVADGKIWEALECLSRAQALVEGTPEAQNVRILTLETQAKIPTLLRAAQQNLEEMARNDPENARVHSALGRIFWEAGLPARARMAFQRVAAIEPSNREATTALAALSDPSHRR